jgi:serine/threonine protein kinase
MPSDSVITFLDRARASRLLPPDQIAELFDQPDAPQGGVAAVCDYLQTHGALTGYQVERIRAGKADELTVAGYPVLDELGACPGGAAYRALHPALRTPVILRRLRRDAIEPGESAEAFIRRARDAGSLVHPHLAHLLDAGLAGDEPYAVLEPFDGADLQTLVGDIGPMPAALATEYGRQIATALHAVHERGLVHGAVRPSVIFAGPLVPMSKTRPDGSRRFRPAPNAITKLFGLGITPRLPNAPAPTSADDLYQFGAALYFLLTGRMPLPDEPLPLVIPRRDLPTGLTELIGELLANDSATRPTAAQTVDRITRIANPNAAPPAAAPAQDIDVILAELTTSTEAPPGGWVAVPYQEAAAPAAPAFTPPAYTGWTPAEEPSSEAMMAAPRRREEKPRSLWVWIIVGATLQLLAVLGWIYLFAR